MIETILKLPKVQTMTGLSRSAIYAKAAKGLFPTPILLGSRSVGWLESEITAWIDQRIKQTRSEKNRKEGDKA